MNPIICKVKPNMILKVVLLFLAGIGLQFIDFRFHMFNDHHGIQLFHITGWVVIVIALLSLMVLKSVRVDERGIRITYIFGISRFFGFQEIVHVSAKMNMTPLSLASYFQNEQRHTIILIPEGGRMRITFSSLMINHFMALYTVLLHTYQAKMEVVDKQQSF